MFTNFWIEYGNNLCAHSNTRTRIIAITYIRQTMQHKQSACTAYTHTHTTHIHTHLPSKIITKVLVSTGNLLGNACRRCFYCCYCCFVNKIIKFSGRFKAELQQQLRLSKTKEKNEVKQTNKRNEYIS